MIDKLLKSIAPVAALALGAALAGCNDMDVTINGETGVPLAELDMSGEAPHSVLLAGPDRVIISDGDALAIDVEGDAEVTELLRFTNSAGTLGIMRLPNTDSGWKGSKPAIINVTMPSPRALTVTGSGSMGADRVEGDVEMALLGSGSLAIGTVAASTLDVTVAASGSVTASGSADRIDLNMLGSGSAQLGGLKVDSADVSVLGSGSSKIASDGTVEANIMGSGSVTVVGRASCEVSALGSGKLICEEAPKAKAAAKKTSANAGEPKAKPRTTASKKAALKKAGVKKANPEAENKVKLAKKAAKKARKGPGKAGGKSGGNSGRSGTSA